jgi:hypothetical protein
LQGAAATLSLIQPFGLMLDGSNVEDFSFDLELYPLLNRKSTGISARLIL